MKSVPKHCSGWHSRGEQGELNKNKDVAIGKDEVKSRRQGGGEWKVYRTREVALVLRDVKQGDFLQQDKFMVFKFVFLVSLKYQSINHVSPHSISFTSTHKKSFLFILKSHKQKSILQVGRRKYCIQRRNNVSSDLEEFSLYLELIVFFSTSHSSLLIAPISLHPQKQTLMFENFSHSVLSP
jgi:hypothetical protein